MNHGFAEEAACPASLQTEGFSSKVKRNDLPPTISVKPVDPDGAEFDPIDRSGPVALPVDLCIRREKADL